MKNPVPALVTGILLASPIFSLAEDFEENKDVTPLNQAITTAAAKGEKWLQDPSVIAARLTGAWLTHDPGSEPGSQSREIVATSEGEIGAGGKVTVFVKEIGLFDDATRRIDHTYEFAQKNGAWVVAPPPTRGDAQ